MKAIDGAERSWFAERPVALAVALGALLLLAVMLRVYRFDAPGTLVDRDYTSAMFARDFYLARSSAAEPQVAEMAHYIRMRQPVLEPPVTEWLVSWLYTLSGHEDLRLARALTCIFWLAGGWFMFEIARRLASVDAAVLALGVYLLLPLSIVLSRSFQPDALMMLLFLAALYCIVRFQQSDGTASLLWAAALSAAVLVYRPLVLFVLVGAFYMPRLVERGWRGLFERESLLFGVLALVPMVAYYGYATFVAKYFGWKFATSFRFDLWAHREYWLGWLDLAVYAVGLLGLVFAVLGVAWMRPGQPRALIAGMTIGYIVFGLMFTMHIHTHGYYQAQLIPIVALAAAPLAVDLLRRSLQGNARRFAWLPAVAAGSLLLVVTLRDVRSESLPPKFESQEVAAEIGRLVKHSRRVVFVARYYGIPLQHNAMIAGAYWPRPITYWLYRTPGERKLSIGERLAALDFDPEYFVITFLTEYENHHADLARYLEGHCVVKARTTEYVIFERCSPPEG